MRPALQLARGLLALVPALVALVAAIPASFFLIVEGAAVWATKAILGQSTFLGHSSSRLGLLSRHRLQADERRADATQGARPRQQQLESGRRGPAAGDGLPASGAGAARPRSPQPPLVLGPGEAAPPLNPVFPRDGALFQLYTEHKC